MVTHIRSFGAWSNRERLRIKKNLPKSLPEGQIFLECLASFFLLVSVILLLRDLLSGYALYLIISLAAGFCFGCFFKLKPVFWLKFFIALSALGIFSWVVISLLAPVFIYKEFISKCVRGVLLLEVIMSLSISLPPFLAYLQILTIPIFMSSAIFAAEYNLSTTSLILAYLALWFVILRLKFYGFFNLEAKRDPAVDQANLASGLFFVIGVIMAGLLLFSFSFYEVEMADFLFRGQSDKNISSDVSEKQYYDSQEKIENEIYRLISSLHSETDKSTALFLLSQLLKDWPDTMEVDRAQQGLISRLKIPGPGLEKGEGEGVTILIKDYVAKKASRAFQRTEEEIIDSYKANNSNLKNLFLVLSQINRIQYSSSLRGIRKYKKQMKRLVNSSFSDKAISSRLEKLTDKLGDWKGFQIYRNKLESLRRRINSLSLSERIKSAFLNSLSQVEAWDNLSDYSRLNDEIDKLDVAAAGVLNDLIAEADEIIGLKLEMLFAEGYRRLRRELESSRLPEAKINELKGLLEDIKDSENYQQFPQAISTLAKAIKEAEVKALPISEDALANQNTISDISKEGAPADLPERGGSMEEAVTSGPAISPGMSNSPIRLAIIFMSAVAAILIIPCFLRRREMKRLISLYKDPREFILNLYENAKIILRNFGLKYNSSLGPLAYARQIEKECDIDDKLFLNFTLKFAEAKYSKHLLRTEDASLTLGHYNNFLKKLLSKYNKFSLLLRYTLIILNKRPFFIRVMGQ